MHGLPNRPQNHQVRPHLLLALHPPLPLLRATRLAPLPAVLRCGAGERPEERHLVHRAPIPPRRDHALRPPPPREGLHGGGARAPAAGVPDGRGAGVNRSGHDLRAILDAVVRAAGAGARGAGPAALPRRLHQPQRRQPPLRQRRPPRPPRSAVACTCRRRRGPRGCRGIVHRIGTRRFPSPRAGRRRVPGAQGRRQGSRPARRRAG
mmetsp:Transcript_18899/g.32527  ORF Transcript_18899/g.32527 Transcript_18899/m.32527 type:complete len:207 (+) Transcript_18899:751-1371(+)